MRSPVQTFGIAGEATRSQEAAALAHRDRALLDLERARPHGAGRFACFALVVVCMGMAVAGNFDYADDLSRQADRVLSRIERQRAADRIKRDSTAARIWSKRCEKQGKDSMATRVDTGPWIIKCVARRTLKA